MPTHPRHRLHREEALRRPSQRSRARSSTPPHRDREQRREALTPYAAVLRPSRSFVRLRSWTTPILGAAHDQRPGCAVAADAISFRVPSASDSETENVAVQPKAAVKGGNIVRVRSMHEKPCGLEAFPWTLRGARASG